MAADAETTGPTTEDNVSDVLWLLLAVLVVLGMVKVFLLAPLPPGPPEPPTDFRLQETAAAAVALERAGVGLPPGGATARPGELAEGLTAGRARRVVVILDGRKEMAPHWAAAVAQVQAQVLGSPSAERVEVVVLGTPADQLPPPLERPADGEPFDPLAVRRWCASLERLSPAADLDPAAATAQALAAAHPDADTRAVLLLRDHGPPAAPAPLTAAGAIQVVLYGPPAAASLERWALRSARGGGSVSFLP